jgi:2,3-dihydro-2,3-dihydroxybenzoate dehydrogenase
MSQSERTVFDGTVALVTGAGGGIGEAVAMELAAGGASVAVTDAAEALAMKVAQNIRDVGGSAVGWALDVTSSSEVHRVADAVEAELGPIDLLINVAGVFTSAPLLDLTDEQWEKMFAVNARGVFFCIRDVGRRMSGRGRGTVVTVVSQSSKVVRLGQSAYGASKAAATYVAKCFGLELARSGIRSNVVHPGVTDTPLARGLWNVGTGSAQGHVDGSLERYRIGVPLGKVGTPEEVAAAVVFLASPRASHITMSEIVVDGGATLIA